MFFDDSIIFYPANIGFLFVIPMCFIKKNLMKCQDGVNTQFIDDSGESPPPGDSGEGGAVGFSLSPHTVR